MSEGLCLRAERGVVDEQRLIVVHERCGWGGKWCKAGVDNTNADVKVRGEGKWRRKFAEGGLQMYVV